MPVITDFINSNKGMASTALIICHGSIQRNVSLICAWYVATVAAVPQ
jgi:hypothetical protein